VEHVVGVEASLDVDEPVPREAGILVLTGDPLEVQIATNAARFWLDQLDDGAGALPTAIASAASVAHAASAKPVATAVRARTRSGRWLTVTADLTDDEHGGHRDVGVVVQPSRPAEIAQTVGGAHGLTARETDVVLLIASGLTNQEIARQLELSPHTVADHLKSIFTKLDVPTRGALTSKLFHDYYLPRVSIDRRAGTDGWFLPD
jgi:DNA-binding CsgD family transcriptional regulator